MWEAGILDPAKVTHLALQNGRFGTALAGAARAAVLQRFNLTAQTSRNPKTFPRYLLPSRTRRDRLWPRSSTLSLRGVSNERSTSQSPISSGESGVAADRSSHDDGNRMGIRITRQPWGRARRAARA